MKLRGKFRADELVKIGTAPVCPACGDFGVPVWDGVKTIGAKCKGCLRWLPWPAN